MAMEFDRCNLDDEPLQEIVAHDGAGTIRFRPVGTQAETRREGWLPPGPATLGITAGASTPNNKIGETIERIAALRGATLASVLQ